MGAWGTGSFENDDAADFVYDVENGGVRILRRAIKAARAERKQAYVEAPSASCLIAAGEIIAIGLGKPPSALPEDVEAFATRLRSQRGLAKRIVPLLSSILEEGELAELWDETGDAAEWRQNVTNLIERLK